MTNFLKNRIVAGVAIGLTVTLISSLMLVAGIFGSLNENFSNNLYTREEPFKDIVIIAIDNKSTQPSPVGLGRFSEWHRGYTTQMLEKLGEDNPSVISFDILYHTETKSIPRDSLLGLNGKTAEEYKEFVDSYMIDNPIDIEFAIKLQSFDNLVLAAVKNGEELIRPLYEFAVNAEIGVVNAYADSTGILRRFQPFFDLDGKSYDSLAVSTVKKYLKTESVELPTEDDEMLVNFFGDPFSFKMVPFVDVVKGEFEPGTFKDKIVLIGATASQEIHDEVLTPRSNSTPMPGVEFHANAIQTIISGKFLHNQSTLSMIALTTLIATLTAILFNYLGILVSLTCALASLGLYYLATHLAYRTGLILNMVYPFLAIALSYVGSWIYKYFIADKKKREMKNAFSHYVSDKLVDQIAQNPDMVKLGGEKKPVTILFSDIKDSTKHSEQTEISAWVSQMNEYFTVMEEIIKRYSGTIDKYEGDAVMCFWNAPIAQGNHAQLAYATALEMKAALAKLNQKWATENRPVLEFRIGINTGEAIVGNFGSETRFDYTASGDTVNTASRLEGSVNKAYGTTICVANPPANTSPAQGFFFREIDTVLVQGKNEPLTVFDIVSDPDLVKNYQSALAAYRQKDFATAAAAFTALAATETQDPAAPDPAAQTMLARTKKLQAGEPILNLNHEMVFRIVGK